MSNKEVKIVLLGKTGAGKSAAGNTILGGNNFISKRSFNSVTETCEVKKADVAGRCVSVVDTPGFFETKMNVRDLAKEIGRSIYLSASGVHAFLLVVPFGRFTDQEVQIFKAIQKLFGKDVTDHLIILFTHGEDLGREVIDSEIKENKHLRSVLQKCKGGYEIFENKAPDNSRKVTELLGKIDTLVEENGGKCYSNDMFKEANCSTWEWFWEKFKNFFNRIAVFFKSCLTPGNEYALLSNDIHEDAENMEMVVRTGVGAAAGGVAGAAVAGPAGVIPGAVGDFVLGAEVEVAVRNRQIEKQKIQ